MRLTIYPFLKLILLLVVFLIPQAGYAADLPIKIGTVDMNQLFKQYHRTKENQLVFSAQFAKIQQQNNTRLATIRELEKSLKQLRLQIEDPTLALNVKHEKSLLFKRKLEEARALDRERQEYIARRSRALELRRQESKQKMLEEIIKHLTEYAKAENYDYVFDRSAQSFTRVPFLPYAKDVVDITADILQIINRKPKINTP